MTPPKNIPPSGFSHTNEPVSEQGVFGCLQAKVDDELREHFKDDAYVSPTGLIISTDVLVDGRHVNQAWSSPADIGWKAAAVSLSDIASCGGRPMGLTVGLALPAATSAAFVNDFYDGLMACLQAYGGQLLGGDTVASPTLTVTTTAIGQLEKNTQPGRRFQAKPGDQLWCCGHHGMSHAGLQAFQQGIQGVTEEKRSHCRPIPKVTEGIEVAKRMAMVAPGQPYALTDTSDGLADGVLNIAEASQVTCEIDAQAIAIHPKVGQWCESHVVEHDNSDLLSSALHTTLYGGEDFGLLAALPPSMTPSGDWSLIGRVLPGEGSAYVVVDGKTAPLTRAKTYQHFGKGNKDVT